MQKDLVLKIAELLCNNAVTDERAKYWVEKSAKLFPGSPAVYKLKVNANFQPLFCDVQKLLASDWRSTFPVSSSVKLPG